MNHLSSSTPRDRALVLGGGGSAGNAWLIGVIAGLCDAGLDVSRADLIVGTSAGSTAAAQITGASPTKLLGDILSAVLPQRTGPGGPGGAVPDHLSRTADVIAASSDAADMRRRMGASAIDVDPEFERSASWRATVAPRLPSQQWPEQRVLITAVDAQTGDAVIFDRDSGVELVDAVAASCAGTFAYRIGDRRYIDGGYRTNAENADLAAGYERVLVLSPFGGRTRLPLEWGLDLATQVEHLRAQGSRVETIYPDADSVSAFGDSMMDLSTRKPSAQAGFAQGRALSAQLGEFWR